MANGNARLDGLNRIFWKKETPSEEEILAIEAKGLGLSAKELAGGVITDDAAKAIGGFQKACRAGEQALQAFIAGWPAELQPILERLAALVPKPAATPPPPVPPLVASSPPDAGGGPTRGVDKPEAQERAAATVATTVATVEAVTRQQEKRIAKIRRRVMKRQKAAPPQPAAEDQMAPLPPAAPQAAEERKEWEGPVHEELVAALQRIKTGQQNQPVFTPTLRRLIAAAGVVIIATTCCALSKAVADWVLAY